MHTRPLQSNAKQALIRQIDSVPVDKCENLQLTIEYIQNLVNYVPNTISTSTGTSCISHITADRDVDRAYSTCWARVLGVDWKRAKPQYHC